MEKRGQADAGGQKTQQCKETRCLRKSVRVLPRMGCPATIRIMTGSYPGLSLRYHLQAKEVEEWLCLLPATGWIEGPLQPEGMTTVEFSWSDCTGLFLELGIYFFCVKSLII